MREIPAPVQKFGERLDSMIAAVAPVWAAKRRAARVGLEIMAAGGSYRGGRQTETRSSWVVGAGSADEDLLLDLPELRARSRDAVRNDPNAAAIANTINTNTVGVGFRPQSLIDGEAIGLSPEATMKLRREAEAIYREAAPYMDAAGRMDDAELLRQVDMQWMTNGEAIILPLMVTDEPWRPYSIAFQVIESDRLETPPGKLSDIGIRSGVEIGQRGQPVAYHIRDTHPGDATFGRARVAAPTYTRIPARQPNGRPGVIHLYTQTRPGQTRGEPLFAPVLEKLQDLASYMEASLVTKRVQACYSAWVTKMDPQGYVATNAKDTQGKRRKKLEPGMIEVLAPGESVQFLTPSANSDDAFVTGILESIAAAIGLPRELIMKAFGGMNYSSARTALLEARRYFRMRQQWLAKKLLNPYWEMLLEEAWLRGKFSAPNFYANRVALCAVRWVAPGWEWVDPLKEAQAYTAALQAGFTTLSEVCASRGLDWEEVAEQRAREKKRLDELGLSPAEVVGAATPAPAAPADDSPDPEDDPEDAADPEDATDPEEAPEGDQ